MIQKPDHVHVVDAPDAFRGKFTGKTAATDYADQVQDVLEQNKGKVAAFIGGDGQKCFFGINGWSKLIKVEGLNSERSHENGSFTVHFMLK